MFNSRLVRESDALLQFETLSWMIQRYGPPTRPAVPSPLHKSPSLADLAYEPTDTRDVHDWADDTVGTIRSACEAESLPIALCTNEDHPHVLFYETARCETPGYLTVRTILHIIELQTAGIGAAMEMEFSPLQNALVRLTAAAYLRQGFTLAALPALTAEALSLQTPAQAVPARLVLNGACFATCLALRARRQTAEQIIATYGMRMSKAFRKKVRQASTQIDGFEPELKLLQLIAEPKPIRASATARAQTLAPALLQHRA